MDDDPQVFLIALGHLARKQDMQEVAKKTGLNRESLYKSISGAGNPHFVIVKKVLKTRYNHCQYIFEIIPETPYLMAV